MIGAVIVLAVVAIALATWLVVELNQTSDLEADLRAEQADAAALRGDLIVMSEEFDAATAQVPAVHPMQADVDELVASFREATANADADAIAALFTVGASSMSPSLEQTIGSVAIGRMYAAGGPMATEILGSGVTFGIDGTYVTAIPASIGASDGLLVARMVDVDGTLLFTDIQWVTR
jgi:hypothetical protein